MEKGVRFDRWGYEVKTSSDSCIEAINAYYQQVLIYGRERKVILDAPLHDKDCVLGNILAACFLCSSDPSRANLYLQSAQSNLEQATSYEKAVFDAISYYISVDRDDDLALELLSKLLKTFPKDLVSLKRAQVLCFEMARPDLSLNLVQQVLPENENEEYIYGMLAFPLLELGRMAEAKEASRKGYEINKQDFWAQHCLCHVLQHECRFKDAVKFMEECSSSWTCCSSFLYTHNWWHVALCYLENGSPISKVLEIYDQYIWKEMERSDAIFPEVSLNALGLFLRADVRNCLDVFSSRLREIVDLSDEASWYLDWHLDVLTVWALAKLGETSKASELLKGLSLRLSKMSDKKQRVMHKAYQLAEVMYEYGIGNNNRALELLGPDFDAVDYKIIGASDEQIDVFNEVWYSLLLETGQGGKAIGEIEKRVEIRDRVPFLWRLLEKAYAIEGKVEATEAAAAKAAMLETAARLDASDS